MADLPSPPSAPYRDALGAFFRAVSATLAVGPALDAFVVEANPAFNARRTSVWLHERRARALNLTATTAERPSAPARVSADDPDALAARGLRLEHPQVLRQPDGPVVVAPLRGWRRALGTLVIEGPVFSDEARLLMQIDELARQLSVGVENVLLLEEVLRARQRLAQSEKLASLGQFVAGIAHEMNNPLQGVLGHLELLMRTADRPLKKELREHVVEDFGLSRRGARPHARRLLLEAERAKAAAAIPGKSRNVHVSTLFTNLQSVPVLLPVWISSYRFKGVTYRFLINGQTGELIGNAPFSYGKLALIIALALGALGAFALLAAS